MKFSLETTEAKRKLYNIFKELKGKKNQPSIILYSAGISFRKGDKTETVSDKVTLREFVTDRCTIKE